MTEMSKAIDKIRNIVVERIIKKWGTSRIKQMIWDKEFREGKLDFIKDSKTDVSHKYVEKYLNGGAILDLGCGFGNLAYELNLDSYSEYVGLDLSPHAINIAKKGSGDSHERSQKIEFIVADITNYEPDRKFDVILFFECIMFFRLGQIKQILDRYSKYLKDNGVIIVRIWDHTRFPKLVDLITHNYHLIEECKTDKGNELLLVFK